MNIPIIVSYIYRNSESNVFARDMSSYERLQATWADSVNDVPTEQELIDNEAAAATWYAEQQAPDPLVALRLHLAKEGYDADAKVSLLHRRMANPTQGAKPKLDAVEAWMLGEQYKAISGTTNFVPAPHLLNEVLAE